MLPPCAKTAEKSGTTKKTAEGTAASEPRRCPTRSFHCMMMCIMHTTHAYYVAQIALANVVAVTPISPATAVTPPPPSKTSYTPSKTKWKRCLAPALSESEHSRLAAAFSPVKNRVGNGFYPFVHRVCKEYKDYIKKKSALMDSLHTHRETLLRSATARVLCAVEGDAPDEWSTDASKETLLQLAEQVFEMPAAGAPLGSDAWLAEQTREPHNISFRHAAQFPKLMTCLVRYLIKKGNERGFPRMGPQETVPSNETYLPTSTRAKGGGANKAHRTLAFLCVSSVNKSIRELKDMGLYPVRVMGEHMPSGKDWHNFAEVLHTFYVFYCCFQGLVRTSARARQVHLYVFYNFFEGPRGRKWPVIRAIHRMTTNGRHRFAATSNKHFTTWFRLLKENPELLSKVNDKGVGEVPPSYTAAVEEGMRSHGGDLHAMGTHAMRSAEDWHKVRPWMKREAYIAAVRTKLGRGSYWQWDHFSWDDYVERQTLTLTFNKRHLPLSDGKNHWDDGVLSDPPQWGSTLPVVKKKGTKGKRSRSAHRRSKDAASVETSSPDVMMFDPALGKLVPVCDLC